MAWVFVEARLNRLVRTLGLGATTSTEASFRRLVSSSNEDFFYEIRRTASHPSQTITGVPESKTDDLTSFPNAMARVAVHLDPLHWFSGVSSVAKENGSREEKDEDVLADIPDSPLEDKGNPSVVEEVSKRKPAAFVLRDDEEDEVDYELPPPQEQDRETGEIREKEGDLGGGEEEDEHPKKQQLAKGKNAFVTTGGLCFNMTFHLCVNNFFFLSNRP